MLFPGVIEHRSSEDAAGIRVVEAIDNDSAAINIRNKWKLSRFLCNSNKKRVRVLKLKKSKSKRVMYNDEEISGIYYFITNFHNQIL